MTDAELLTELRARLAAGQVGMWVVVNGDELEIVSVDIPEDHSVVFHVG